MAFGNTIGNKIEHNTEGHEDTKRRLSLGRMKTCWKRISCLEWLMLPLMGFTIFVLIFFNVYPKESQATGSLGTNTTTTTSLGEMSFSGQYF